MLHIYTRQSADCDHADNTQWRRCRCPKWLRGVLPNGETVRESAGTRSWEQAERNARKKEVEADPTRVNQVQPRRETVKEAIRMCLEDEEARGLEHSSRKKSRTLLERQFLPFCEARKFVHIDQLLPIDLTEFRSTWNNGEATTHRKHERMHSFFAFCVANDMLPSNWPGRSRRNLFRRSKLHPRKSMQNGRLQVASRNQRDELVSATANLYGCEGRI